ncbi:hypothetical protein Tco_0451169 [Tanacetum coccineum]
MKAVKDKYALQKNIDSWFASSKNLWKLIDCGMSSTIKIGLGYGIQSNAEVLGYEEEISRGIFDLRETDAGYYDIPLYNRFKQVEYKGVPHPLSGDYTPREQEDIDGSLYEYGKYGPQPQSPSPTVSDASSTVYSTCPSNDSDGELGAVSEHSVNDDPIHDHIPIPSIEQVTIATQKTQLQVPKPKQTVIPSCAQHVKTPRQPIRTPVTPLAIPSNNRQNWNQRMERELGKFDGKSDEGFLVGYSVNSKAFRVYNLVTKRVEVNLHVNFLEEKPNVQGIGHRWMFDLDYLTDSMNYIPVSLQNQANPAGSKEVIDIDVQTKEDTDLMVVSSTSLAEATRKAAVSEKIAKKKTHSPKKPSSTPISKSADDIMTFRKELDALALKHLGPVPAPAPTSTNPVNTGSDNLNTVFEEVTSGNIEAISPSDDHEEEVFSDADDDEMPEIRIYDKSSEGIFEQASYDDDGIITDFNNLPDKVDVTTNHTLRIHNAHPQSQILGDPNTPVQTRSSLKKITEAHALVSYIQAQQRSNHKDQQHCLFACFLSQSEPRKVSEALEDGSWVETNQEETCCSYQAFNKYGFLLIYPMVQARIEAISECPKTPSLHETKLPLTRRVCVCSRFYGSPHTKDFSSQMLVRGSSSISKVQAKLGLRVESLEKELSDTKQTLGTAILQLIEKVKKLENKLRKKRKSEETEDAEGQDQEVPSQTDQGNAFVTPEKSKDSGEAQADQISPSTLEA